MEKNNISMVCNTLNSIHNECIKNKNCNTCSFYIHEPSQNLNGCIFDEVEVRDYGHLIKIILKK